MDININPLSVAEIAKLLEDAEAAELKRIKEGYAPLRIVDYITKLDSSGNIPTGFGKVFAGGFKKEDMVVFSGTSPSRKSTLQDILESAGDRCFKFNALTQTIDLVAPELNP